MSLITTLTGQIMEESIRLDECIGTGPSIHWFSGTDVHTKSNYWILVSQDSDFDPGEGFTRLTSPNAIEATFWHRPCPSGQSLSSSLVDGPLTPNQLLQLTIQLLAAGDKISFNPSEIWWDEGQTKLIEIGLNPTTKPIELPASQLKCAGLFLWHLATGDGFNGNPNTLTEKVPEPFPQELLTLISALCRTGRSSHVTTLTDLSTRLNAILVSMHEGPEPVTAHTRALTTQEIWQASKDEHIARAAGQPIFFIVGGLVSAIVLSILGSLGFFAPDESGASPANESSPIEDQAPDTPPQQIE